MKKLSIALTTYNHENYISEAIDSILAQNLDLDYEIVVGNDCSTDNTGLIIENYAKIHPGLFLILERNNNLGYIKNFDLTLQACQGEYVAIFDGDDIMLPGKLKAQVDFLDQNPNCVMVGHNARVFKSESGQTVRIIKPKRKKSFYGIEDLIHYGSFFANSSKMYRRAAYPPDGIDSKIKKIADWYITIEIAKQGKIGFIHEVLVDYRVHGHSIMQTISGHIQSHDIHFILEKIRRQYPGKYDSFMRRQSSYAHIASGLSYMAEGDIKNARKYFLKSVFKDPFYGSTAYFYFLQSFLYIFKTSGRKIFEKN